jgi:hypothetical protein
MPYESQLAYIFCPDDNLMREIVANIEAEQLPLLRQRRPKTQINLFNSDEDKATIEAPEEWNPYNITPISSRLTNGREMVFGANRIQPMQMPAIETPSDIEGRLRNQIERHIRLFCYINRFREKRINARIKREFGKARDLMTIPELERVKDYIERRYPVNGGKKPRGWKMPVRARRVWEL